MHAKNKIKKRKDTFVIIKMFTMTINLELHLPTQLIKTDAIIHLLMNKYSIPNNTNKSTSVAIKLH
mgnify:CR=1 FL=1